MTGNDIGAAGQFLAEFINQWGCNPPLQNLLIRKCSLEERFCGQIMKSLGTSKNSKQLIFSKVEVCWHNHWDNREIILLCRYWIYMAVPYPKMHVVNLYPLCSAANVSPTFSLLEAICVKTVSIWNVTLRLLLTHWKHCVLMDVPFQLTSLLRLSLFSPVVRI